MSEFLELDEYAEIDNLQSLQERLNFFLIDWLTEYKINNPSGSEIARDYVTTYNDALRAAEKLPVLPLELIEKQIEAIDWDTHPANGIGVTALINSQPYTTYHLPYLSEIGYKLDSEKQLIVMSKANSSFSTAGQGANGSIILTKPIVSAGYKAEDAIILALDDAADVNLESKNSTFYGHAQHYGEEVVTFSPKKPVAGYVAILLAGNIYSQIPLEQRTLSRNVNTVLMERDGDKLLVEDTLGAVTYGEANSPRDGFKKITKAHREYEKIMEQRAKVDSAVDAVMSEANRLVETPGDSENKIRKLNETSLKEFKELRGMFGYD